MLEENEQRKKVEEHNEKRTKTQAYRDQNRSERQILKEQQLDACQDMQVGLRCRAYLCLVLLFLFSTHAYELVLCLLVFGQTNWSHHMSAT